MICAVVLAAGRSERMGTQKLLLPLGGKPVITRVVDELLRSRVEQIRVVMGHDGERVRQALGNHSVQFVENLDPASDMLGSLRHGLRELSEECEAVLVVLGDQPGMSHELVNGLVRCFRENKSKIIVPVCNGHRGHPVLISTRFCDEVLSRQMNDGLRGFLDAHAGEVFSLAVSDVTVLEDMDTPADYQRQEKLFTTSIRP